MSTPSCVDTNGNQVTSLVDGLPPPPPPHNALSSTSPSGVAVVSPPPATSDKSHRFVLTRQSSCHDGDEDGPVREFSPSLPSTQEEEEEEQEWEEGHGVRAEPQGAPRVSPPPPLPPHQPSQSHSPPAPLTEPGGEELAAGGVVGGRPTGGEGGISVATQPSVSHPDIQISDHDSTYCNLSEPQPGVDDPDPGGVLVVDQYFDYPCVTAPWSRQPIREYNFTSSRRSRCFYRSDTLPAQPQIVNHNCYLRSDSVPYEVPDRPRIRQQFSDYLQSSADECQTLRSEDEDKEQREDLLKNGNNNRWSFTDINSSYSSIDGQTRSSPAPFTRWDTQRCSIEFHFPAANAGTEAEMEVESGSVLAFAGGHQRPHSASYRRGCQARRRRHFRPDCAGAHSTWSVLPAWLATGFVLSAALGHLLSFSLPLWARGRQRFKVRPPTLDEYRQELEWKGQCSYGGGFNNVPTGINDDGLFTNYVYGDRPGAGDNRDNKPAIKSQRLYNGRSDRRALREEGEGGASTSAPDNDDLSIITGTAGLGPEDGIDSNTTDAPLNSTSFSEPRPKQNVALNISANLIYHNFTTVRTPEGTTNITTSWRNDLEPDDKGQRKYNDHVVDNETSLKKQHVNLTLDRPLEDEVTSLNPASPPGPRSDEGEGDGEMVTVGMWNICRGETCWMWCMDQLPGWFRLVQAFTTLGLVLCLVTSTLAVCQIAMPHCKDKYLATGGAAIVLLLGESFCVVAVSVFGAHVKSDMNLAEVKLHPSWSFYISLLSIVTGLLGVVSLFWDTRMAHLDKMTYFDIDQEDTEEETLRLS